MSTLVRHGNKIFSKETGRKVANSGVNNWEGVLYEIGLAMREPWPLSKLATLSVGDGESWQLYLNPMERRSLAEWVYMLKPMLQRKLPTLQPSLYFRSMNWATVADYIAQEWHAITILEIIAVAFSVTEVLLSYRNNVLLYPAGIVACFLGIWLMGRAGLYAEAILSMYYLVMSFYGWYKWRQRNKRSEYLPITACSPADWRIVVGICVVAFVVLFFTLKTFTDSTVPYMDAFVSATAWAGMWLLAKRKLENWVLLNISNIVAIPLLFYKHLPLMALLTTFLFIVAVLGYFRWKKIMQEDAAKQDADLPTLFPAGQEH